MSERKTNQREILLNRYADGEYLTAPELEFLANTSDLLNRCIDKEAMRNLVKRVDRE